MKRSLSNLGVVHLVFIWILSIVLAILIIIGVLKHSHWLFNIVASIFSLLIFVVDLILYGWHEESLKIAVLCLIIIIFEVVHSRIKYVQNEG